MIHPSNFRTLVLDVINQFGGISGVIRLFKEKGQGSLTQSWLRGMDLDQLSSHVVNEVFGFETVRNWAEKVNIKPDVASEQIAKFLPSIIHHLSPNGQVPEGTIREDQISSGVFERFKELFKKSA
jgi:uncharacterized protein YidB (DUF937 family)